jgi:hypothetical protein
MCPNVPIDPPLAPPRRGLVPNNPSASMLFVRREEEELIRNQKSEIENPTFEIF